MTRRETVPGRTVRQGVILSVLIQANPAVRRTSSTLHPRIWRGLAATLLLASGCVTPLPLQPASALPEGTLRLGGQLAASPWCSFTANPILNCALEPPNLPLPELRVDARLGLGGGYDVGLSGRGAGVLSRGGQVGLLADVKKELWSRELSPGRRQILSVGPALGADVAFVLPAASALSLSAALPLYFGHQTERFEWVVSPRLVERLVGTGAPSTGLANVEEFGLALGMFSRTGTRYGIQLSYQAPFAYPAGGVFSVGAGLFFDLGGRAEAPRP